MGRPRFVLWIHLCDHVPLLWTSLFGRRVSSFVSGCISEIVAGYVLDWYILIREHVRFLCLSQSPRLYTRPKSNQSRFANRLANDRTKHMNLLERFTDTCLTKAAFSRLSGRLHRCKEATISISWLKGCMDQTPWCETHHLATVCPVSRQAGPGVSNKNLAVQIIFLSFIVGNSFTTGWKTYQGPNWAKRNLPNMPRTALKLLWVAEQTQSEQSHQSRRNPEKDQKWPWYDLQCYALFCVSIYHRLRANRWNCLRQRSERWNMDL